MLPRILIVGLLALILGVPFLMRPEAAKVEDVGPEGTLVVVTPHVPQIQHEFGLAFDRWHRRVHGTPVRIDWRQPGGTSEIIKQLAAQYSSRCAEVVEQWGAANPDRLAAASLDLTTEFPPGSVAFDVMFGGGSFDHGRLKDVNTASYWFRPFQGQAAAEVLVRTKGPIEPATVVNERQLIATVTREGSPAMVLRIPLSAMVEQAAALAAIAQASRQSPPGDARVRLDLSQLERQAAVSISVPAGFEQARLDAWYGPNVLGAGTLYDPQQHWLGTAISGFGVVYNKDVLAKLGVESPRSFEDLTDPRLVGWLAFADPRQSGSVATAIDSVLSYYGWEKGWKVLREMCANTRYYTNTAPRPPIDVSQGEAAAGLCIDFYGRNQSQAVLPPGETDATKSRVGYVDPQGATYMDADPVSILRGGPNAALAKRFVEFTLTEEAQALWQFPSKRDPASATNPVGESGAAMGPDHHELRRMPVRRVMYERHMAHMIDQVDPFRIATTTKPAGWRSTIGVMMGSFGIETADLQVRAWKALNAARANPDFDQATLAEMEERFYAWPTTLMPDGKELPFRPEHVKAITGAWKDAVFRGRCEVRYFEFFTAQYRRVIELGS
ncbi:MAG: Phosphoglycerate transport regulatory protein PgtC precursor [Planctomycetota bacterium]|jgi:ABC-type Fe3+ transport system substrate-binding protein